MYHNDQEASGRSDLPKTINHQERRTQIADGLIRLAGREGLHAVTMRAVAAESGVSLRLVQYYFKNKAQLMHAALKHLEYQSHKRWKARLSKLPSPPPLRSFLETLFTEAMPTDECSRTFHLVWTSYAVMAATNPELAAEPFIEGPNRLEQQLVEILRDAQATGDLTSELDVSIEATRLLAMNHGLGTMVLVGQHTTETAMAVLQHHLDQLLSKSS